MNDKVIDVTQLFLTASGIFAVALADAETEALKTGLGIVAVVFSLTWVASAVEMRSISGLTRADHLILWLSWLSLIGWSGVALVHGYIWKKYGVRPSHIPTS